MLILLEEKGKEGVDEEEETKLKERMERKGGDMGKSGEIECS